MATRAEIRRRLEQLMDDKEPRIQRAFRVAMQELREGARVERIVEALERGDVNAALDAMRIETSALRGLEREIEAAFEDSGEQAQLPPMQEQEGSSVLFRFNVRDEGAERILRRLSGGLIRNITEDQREMVQERLTAGMEQGQNPRDVALGLVGRINKQTGRRQGGVVGLTVPQARYSASAREELESGDPEMMRNYLNRTLRDKRHDPRVNRAIREEKPIPAADVKKMVSRYNDKMLRHRGQMIARTETLAAVNAARHEAFRQKLEQGPYSEQDVIREWDSSGDGRVRHTHRTMNGQRVRSLSTPFTTPYGAQMMYPGDASLGAPASEVIHCRCIEQLEIDYFGDAEL